MKTRYIFSMGKLQKKDKSIVFKNRAETIYIPIADTKEIYCLNEVSLNSKLFNQLSRYKIVLHFFNYYGNYIGTFYPKRQLISGKLTIAQVKAYETQKEQIAKAIVLAIAKNIHEILYHYYRHGKKELKPFLDYLKKDIPNILSKPLNHNQIFFVEGQIWNNFYDSFKYFLPKEFLISKRVKRPPNNPMNALISFGNSMLYTKTISAIYRTHLNQSISFLHSPNEGRFSLSLDLSEAFKPVIVFKTIFELINRKQIQIEKHFDKSLNYSILNNDGKKIFLQAFEDRLNKTFMHTRLKRLTTFYTAIKYDGYKLIKAIMFNKEFVPFSLKDKM